MNLKLWILWIVVSTVAATQNPLGGETLEQAVERLFPGGSFQRQTAYLDAEEQRRVKSLCGTDCRGVVYPYVVSRGGEVVATLYLDRHTVRSKRETLLVALSPDGAVHSVSVLQFAEPKRYLPPARWYQQFRGLGVATPPRVGRNIDGMSGATLTTRATAAATHRTLAVHAVLEARKGDGGPP